MKFPLSTHLAILQQGEYEVSTYHSWIKTERQDLEIIEHLKEVEPEKWTRKLKIIRQMTRVFHLLLSVPQAIILSTKIVSLTQAPLTGFIIWRAQQKLRRYQKQGLTTIAIAGSYGKTSVKFATTQMLSQHYSTLTTPASFNTPLSIAQTILGSLNQYHRFFVVELGEFSPDDIADFLEFLRPSYGILTPVGFSHLARFGSEKQLLANFQHLFTSKWAPKRVFVDIHNKSVIKDYDGIDWYGGERDKRLHLEKFTPSLSGSSVVLRHRSEKYSFTSPVLSAHQITNCFPGILLLEELGYDLLPTIKSLEYLPTPERRLEVHHNANGTVVVDNSYNSNPGSWKGMVSLIEDLKAHPLAIITAGFVELDEKTAQSAHKEMAEQLLELADIIAIVKTRDNRNLIEALQEKRRNQSIITGVTQMDVLNQIALLSRPIKYIWLEGGVRELYQ